MDVRDTLLLACGTTNSRGTLRSIFEENFNLLEAANDHQALMLLEQNCTCIAAVLLDLNAPGNIDEEGLSSIVTFAKNQEIPVVVIAEEAANELIVIAFGFGVTEVVFYPYDSFVLQQRVHNIVELYRHKWHLEERVSEQASLLHHFNDAMVDALSSIIEYRSVESGQHILRIRHFTRILLDEIARSCPEYQLTEPIIQIISSASALHDIGKISIPDAILNKPGRLTPEEWKLMQHHTLSGCQILESLRDVGNHEYLRYAHNICHYHHERWDGGGYPEGISGDNIPICAQVVGLSDAYDALTTKRAYKDAIPCKQAVNMILNGECGVFSSKLLACFKVVADKFEVLARDYADGLSPRTESFDTTLPFPVAQDDPDTLQSVIAKFHALIHHINGMIIEANLHSGYFHIIYNPYPELTPLKSSSSFEKATQSFYNIIAEEDHKKFYTFLHTDIPAFLQNGIRKQMHQFHTNDPVTHKNMIWQAILLRPDFNHEDGNLLILWQQLNLSASHITAVSAPSPLPEEIIHNLGLQFFCCRNDRFLSLEQVGHELPLLLGYTAEELLHISKQQFIELIVSEDRQTFRQQLFDQLRESSKASLFFRLRHKDGHAVWVWNHFELYMRTDGSEFLYGMLSDITPARKKQDGLQLQLEQYQNILSKTENVLFEWDFDQDTISFSSQWETIFGYPPMRDHVLSQISTSSHFHPEDIPGLFQYLRALQNDNTYQVMEMRIAKSDGRYLWCRFRATATLHADGSISRIAGIIINIDEEKRTTKALQDRADRDALTKLLNKNAARRQAEEYLSSFPQGTRSALLIIDLDNFKKINDQYGHMFGDAVLSQVSREIKKFFRSQDIVARIGGDEFLILMRGITDQNLVKNRCSQIISVIRNLFRSQLNSSPLGCSIGVSFAPEHGTTYHELFQHADQALYLAKRNGKNNYNIYNHRDTVTYSYGKSRTAVNEQIDSNERPGLADNSIVHYTLQRLYESGDIETTVNDIIKLIGQQMNVSRVYVFENSPDNKTCSNTFEWCNTGIQPEIDHLQNISYEKDIPGFMEMFNEHGIFYCPDIDALSGPVFDILKPQGIQSLLHCAILDNGVFRGYVGFDECSAKRLWTREQIDVLTFFSEILSVFLLKKRAQDATAQYADDLHSILDNQNAWIYVIDPDTCELLFLNAKAKQLSPHISLGTPCYRALMGYQKRCPNCPALQISEKKTNEQVLFNEQFGLKLLSEATLIQWKGQKACLITCREIKNTIT